jgi:hypothetical protein
MEERFLLKTSATLIGEIRALIADRGPMIRASTSGRLWWLRQSSASEAISSRSAPIWILQAHLGTLDKLDLLLTHEREPGTFEALGVARNLFENLIWVRLFNLDQRWGIVFYHHLLLQQKQSTEQMIAKVRDEISLFEEVDAEDNQILDETLGKAILETDDPKLIAQAREAHRALQADLDMRVRRSFALYAAAARFNSYAYQSHILRERVVPDHEAKLTSIRAAMDALTPQLPNLLDQRLLNLTNARWNWRQRADEVGMAPQYDFLYSYTSKLLHSTPLNIITEKELSASEVLVMLDYIFVATSDLLDAIDTFDVPGAANVLLFEVYDESDGEEAPSGPALPTNSVASSQQ